MIKWAGRLIVLYGAAHTLGALTLEDAASHAGAWFSGDLWGEDLSNMSDANSALWLSVDSFGVPLIMVGLMVLWLDRRGITPPPFIAWTLGTWTLVDGVISGPTPWPILLLAFILLLVGARRATHRDDPTLASSAGAKLVSSTGEPSESARGAQAVTAGSEGGGGAAAPRRRSRSAAAANSVRPSTSHADSTRM
jgi:hypothetical protein